MNLTAESTLDVQSQLGEGPVWFKEALWFVDIELGELHRFRPSTLEHARYSAGQRISFAVPASDGSWIVGLEGGLAFWRVGEGQPEVFANPESDLPRNRFNDGKCDPSGRLYGGTMRNDGAAGHGALYRVDDDLVVRKTVSNVSISNGLAWDLELERMYYNDTKTCRTDVFDWCPATGELSNRQTLYQFDETEGVPDGMCFDVESRLWVAMWGGSRVVAIDVNLGRQVGKIAVEATQVTSCCFGGPGRNELFITTARVGLDGEALSWYPKAGNVFRAEMDTAGHPCDVFKGRQSH